ncbi:MAG TPA: hypothetical protein VNN08_16640 [Thermoanaerobaculia bacterium]|nr:hypothetical protein [Thermoanaerobaculia bacterium]
MIPCQRFRANLQPGTTDAALLEHLRHCDSCLDFAMGVDPDLFFRSIGGEELIPPGGVDAFVGDVMSQVRVRSAETSLAPHGSVSVWQRLAIAATIAAGVTGATLVYSLEQRAAAPNPAHAAATAVKPVAARSAALATKSFVETYSSHNATMVEVPNDGSDAKIVMIFDDTLPADL